MTIKTKTILLSATGTIAMFLTTNTPATAQTFGIDNFTPSGSLQTNFNDTNGYRYQINTNFTVQSLGMYDVGGDGLNRAYDVGLWEDGGTLLASVTVPSGTTAPLVNGFRYVNLGSSVNLTANSFYRIGVFYGGSLPTEGYYFNENLGTEWNSTVIASVEEYYNTNTTTLSFPNAASSSNQALIGPNFSGTALSSGGGSVSVVPFEFSTTPGLIVMGGIFGIKHLIKLAKSSKDKDNSQN